MKAKTGRKGNAETLPFNLHERERVIVSIGPERRPFIIKRMLSGIVMMFFAIVFLSVFAMPEGWWAAAAVAVAIIAVATIFALVSYDKYRYWLTNERIVGSRGFIGFSIDSLPLDMIADVILNRGLVDRLLGVSSLYISPIGGISLAGSGKLSGINYLIALPPDRARELQEMIFRYRKKVKGGRKGI